MRTNGSYGLTTLCNAHAHFIRQGEVRFAFRGRGGKPLEARVSDARLVGLVRRCRELPGQALLQYREDDIVHRIGSADINDYLQATLGGPFTAEDFRTWGATLFAFLTFATTPLPDEGDDARQRIRQATLLQAAAILGNTPRICEKCCVDPRVFAGWEDGRIQQAASRARGLRQ